MFLFRYGQDNTTLGTQHDHRILEPLQTMLLNDFPFFFSVLVLRTQVRFDSRRRGVLAVLPFSLHGH